MRRMLAFLSVCLVVLLLTRGELIAQGQSHRVFLPLVAQPKAPQALPANPGQGALFLTHDFHTNSASVAVDGSGRVHVALAEYGDNNGDGISPAIYGTCAFACARPESWQFVALGDRLQEVQLAVTESGAPRMLLRSLGSDAVSIFTYAACEMGCERASQWTLADVGSNRIIGEASVLYDLTKRYFALDRQGRPRFVYSDERAGLGRYGTFFAWCDAGCAQAASWSESLIADRSWPEVSLAFAPNGEPRVAFSRFPNLGIQEALYYVECTAYCADGTVTNLGPIGLDGSEYVLRIDAQGRPRLALYQTREAAGGTIGLHYLSCESECSSASSWRRTPVGLPAASGREPDLAFDGVGRAHLAYRLADAEGLGYSVCAGSCDNAQAWQHRVADPSARLDLDWRHPVPPDCQGGAWAGGYRPSLAVDRTGQARIAYDGEFNTGLGCFRQTELGRGVRVVLGLP